MFSMFCFPCLEKMVSHFCVTLLFLILRFLSVSCSYCPSFDVSKVVFLMEMMENYLLYSVSVLLFFFFEKAVVREKIRCIFHYF